MLIDWFTTIAQIINFLILVFLLKHFLYGPIIRAMDRREQRIADRLNDARSTREEAEQEKEEYRQKSEQLEEEKKSILDEARQKAEEQRQEMQRQVRQEMEEARSRWQHELARQQEAFLGELEQRTSSGVLAIANRALQDLADQELQESMCRVFIRRLKELERKTVEKLTRSLDEAQPAVTVQSAFALTASAKQQLTKAVHEVLGKSVSVNYEMNERLLAGLQLNSSNDVIGWHLEEYFRGLQEELTGFLDRQHKHKEDKDENKQEESPKNAGGKGDKEDE